MPLFGDSEYLYHAIAQHADAICQAYASGRTDVLWNILHACFTACRDELDGARTTRLQVWRRIDRLRHELQRQRQGLGECRDLAELATHILSTMEQRALKDAPTTLEGVLSYFYEFDPRYTEPYDEELHGLAAVQELTGSDWQGDLARCLAALPVELRQAVEVRFALQPQPVFHTDTEFRRHYGCSPRTMRDRATRALQRLREAMDL
jgi:DNA-directed RNA polymerase specialized sigma24 family protein